MMERFEAEQREKTVEENIGSRDAQEKKRSNDIWCSGRYLSRLALVM